MSELEVSKEASGLFPVSEFGLKVKDFQKFYIESMAAGADEEADVNLVETTKGLAFKVDIPCEISYSRTAPVTHRFDTFIDFARNYGAASLFLFAAIVYIALVIIITA